MPIYEYVCDQCHAEFEALVRGDETPECPACGSHKLAKQWSKPASPASSDSLPCGPACGVDRPRPT